MTSESGQSVTRRGYIAGVAGLSSLFTIDEDGDGDYLDDILGLNDDGEQIPVYEAHSGPVDELDVPFPSILAVKNNPGQGAYYINENRKAIGIGGPAAVADEDIHPKSTDTDRAAIKEQPTGPEGSYVGQRGGLSATITPSLSWYPNVRKPNLRVYFQDGTTAYAADNTSSNAGIIYKTTDHGQSWTQKGDVGTELSALQKIGATGTLIAVDANAAVHRSTDDGSTWTQITTLDYTPIGGGSGITDTPSGNILIGEYANDTNTSYDLWLSTDDGQSWSVTKSTNTNSSIAYHWHNVTWDPHEGKLICMVDKGNPDFYTSDDEGSTLNLLATADTDRKPNWVSPALMTDYVAWAYDSNARAGWVSYMDRADFYSGNWTNDKVHDVAKINDNRGYYAAPIGGFDSDVFVQTFSVESSDDYGGSELHEIHFIYDDGHTVRCSGGAGYTRTTGGPESGRGGKALPPSWPHDTKMLGGVMWLNLQTGGANSPNPMLFMAGESDVQQIPQAESFTPFLPNNYWLRAKTTTGGQQKVLAIDGNDDLKVINPGGGLIRGYGSGLWGFLYGGSLSFSVNDGHVSLRGSDLTDIKEYSDDTNAPTNSLYYDTTDGQLEYKDSGGTIHPLG